MQRMCTTFRRGPQVQFLAHLDLLRLWHRALRRAGLPLVYSQGYHPRPRVSLACPLPVGITSQGELLEFFLRQHLPLRQIEQALTPNLPQGIEVLRVEEVPLYLAPLSSLVRWIDYQAEVTSPRSPQEVAQAIQQLMEKPSLPWQHARDTGPHHYDLRPLILELKAMASAPGHHILGMRLRCDSRGAGRPEQVVAALGLPPPTSLHRLRVGLAQA